MPKGVRKVRKPQQAPEALDDIKKLLILLLNKSGAGKAEIAAALGVDPSAVSRMLDWSKVKDSK